MNAPALSGVVHLKLRPHIEKHGTSAGCHSDRFDVMLDGEVICTHRSGWHTPARKLLELGYPPDTLLHVQHEGKPHDPTIVPKAIGAVAQWEIVETDKGGLVRRRWRPFAGPGAKPHPLAAMYPDLWDAPAEWPWGGPQSCTVEAPAATEASPGTPIPPDDPGAFLTGTVMRPRS